MNDKSQKQMLKRCEICFLLDYLGNVNKKHHETLSSDVRVYDYI